MNSIVELIHPNKDVDGLSPVNMGKLASRTSEPTFYPCTPLGIIKLCEYYHLSMSRRRVVVVGRSEIVGIPMALMLNRQDATVTLCHSKTVGLSEVLRNAEVVIAAVGKPGVIRGDWIQPGAIVIDVGINRIDNGRGKNKLVGDIDPNMVNMASAWTPVPGGVGPMTVAMLVHNVFRSALRWHDIQDEELKGS